MRVSRDEYAKSGRKGTAGRSANRGDAKRAAGTRIAGQGLVRREYCYSFGFDE
jgi:hypothetical protein